MRAYQINQELTDKLSQQILNLMQKANVPGLALVLIRNAEIFWDYVCGVQSVVTGETLFEAASLSKPVFAYAALKLCDTGLLDLDTPLANYLSKPCLANEPQPWTCRTQSELAPTGSPNFGKPRVPRSIRIPLARGQLLDLESNRYG
jgi:CubicO group peptidase (beta-lactamase class C family)